MLYAESRPCFSPTDVHLASHHNEPFKKHSRSRTQTSHFQHLYETKQSVGCSINRMERRRCPSFLRVPQQPLLPLLSVISFSSSLVLDLFCICLSVTKLRRLASCAPSYLTFPSFSYAPVVVPSSPALLHITALH